ncbi:hypothetical protein [Phaeospirillum tilakii]|uniref:Uncharacterized protein n=1 Tax=Phaeospirillum tilakii TaxID=741673 RepID=A0ABW5CF22_9PROT
MSQTFVHPHAEFDRFPALVEEFGADVVADIIAAEAADFAWDSRFAERNLGAWDGCEDEDFDAESVRIIGYFRSRYIVATCLVDADRRVRALLKQRHFDHFEDAEQAFLDGGG